MKGNVVFGMTILGLGTMFLLAACGGEDATPEPPEDLTLETCSITEIASIGPVRAFRGEDPIPTGFDSINSADCTFSMPIASINVQLSRQGQTVFDQTFPLNPVDPEVGFPLPSHLVPEIPVDWETGRYERRMSVTSAEGQTMEVVLDFFKVADVVWIFDSARSPESAAREALGERLGVAPDAPSLIAFEPVDWEDTSLGCPEPGNSYAQVITPGFRLVLGHTVGTRNELHEYHTDEDGSVVVTCTLTSSP